MAKKIVVITQGHLDGWIKPKPSRRAKNVVYRAYKVSDKEGHGIYFPTHKPRLTCKEGAVLRVPKANRNIRHDCGAGVNVATKDWCIRFGRRSADTGHRLWLVEFRPKDIACIPYDSSGKMRLFRCKVLKRVRML